MSTETEKSKGIVLDNIYFCSIYVNIKDNDNII